MRFGIFPVMAGRRAGGTETYEIALVRSLATINRHDEFHVYCLSPEAVAAFGFQQENFRFHTLRPRWRWLSVPISLPARLLADGVKLFHASFTPPPFSLSEYVFTHHCFSTFNHPEFYDPAVLLRLNRLIVTGLRKARLVICVSQNVLDLTAEKFSLPRDRMVVVPNGVGDQFRPIEPATARDRVAEHYGIEAPYMLFVSKLQLRKNVTRMVEAFDAFRRETGSDWKLVLAGNREVGGGEVDRVVARLGIESSVVSLDHVDWADLPTLYSGAEVFVFPSLWEGFGIPVLEAMACGTPVITSNLSSLPEVAGDAALTVDPYSVDEIAGAMCRLAADSALRRELSARGIARAAHFSWRRTAEATLAAYRRAAELA